MIHVENHALTRDKLIAGAESWAHHAYLRSIAEPPFNQGVEEALVWTLFFLWAADCFSD